MQKNLHSLLQVTAVVATLSVAGCSSNETGAADSTKDGGCPAAQAGCPAGCPGAEPPPVNPGTADAPPTGADADVKAWLAKGDYKTGSWKCEAAPHVGGGSSPHGMNRICSNKTTSEHPAGTPFPVGAANVKELYDTAGTNLVGLALYRKLKTGGGEGWYWWEEMNEKTVVNSLGDKGVAKDVCVGCHSKANNDQVFTQVK